MDTITHGIVGALAGKALFAGYDVPAHTKRGAAARALSSPTAQVAIAGCTLASVFPDIDIFAGPLARNPLAIIEWHRNFTHSVALLPLWALLLSAATLPVARWLRWKAPSFLALYVIYAVGLASHILLDLVTNFGTMVWSPLRRSRPAWDWIFIVDLTLTGIALTPQIVAWCYREPSRFLPRAVGAFALLCAGAYGTYLFGKSQGYGFPLSVVVMVWVVFSVIVFLPAAKGIGFGWTRAAWCRAGLVVLCIYIGVAAAMHHKALEDVKSFASAQHLQAGYLAALPLPPSLLHWAGLITTEDGVWRTTFHEPSGAVDNTEFFLGPPSRDLVKVARKLPDVQIYLWFARFPVWRVVPLGGNETAVEISDARFFREGDPFADTNPRVAGGIGPIPTRKAGFTFRVVFDAHGRVVSHGFKEPE